MIDLHLRTDTEQQMIEALPQFRHFNDSGIEVWNTGTKQHGLSIIGKVKIGEEEDETPIFDEGFHVNIRCIEEIASTIPEDIIVTPSDPVQVWL